MTDFDTQAGSTPAARPGALANADAHPWVTLAYIAACVGIFLSLARADGALRNEDLAHFGVMSARDLRGGALHGLFAPAVVHIEFFHLAFNMYWLWLLGGACERVLGSWKYALLVVGSALAASSLQFAVSDSTGIGASGVMYALFGFGWISRPRSPELAAVVDDRTVQLLLIWLVACFPLTYFDILPIANGAHVGGLLFGMTAAALFVLRRRRALMAAALVAILLLPSVSLVWAPWSTLWLSDRAVEEQIDGNYEESLEYYAAVLEREPANGWAYHNRSMVHEALGDHAAAQRDRELAARYGMPR